MADSSNSLCPHCHKTLKHDSNFCRKCGFALAHINSTFAGFWHRFLGFAIDEVILMSVLIVPAYFISVAHPFTFLAYWPFAFAVFIGYHTYFIGKYGATIGKKLVGLKVVDNYNNLLGFKRAFYRFVFFMVSMFMFGLGFLMIIPDKQNQSLHDHLVETFVILEKVSFK